jgi:hypothetical protein
VTHRCKVELSRSHRLRVRLQVARHASKPVVYNWSVVSSLHEVEGSGKPWKEQKVLRHLG